MIWSGTVRSPEYVTRALRFSRLTSTRCTPATDLTAVLTLPAQAKHAIPSTGISIVLGDSFASETATDVASAACTCPGRPAHDNAAASAAVTPRRRQSERRPERIIAA